VDLAAEKAGDEFLISMKWQQSSGTAEQKVPFEIICLAEAIRETSSYKPGYVVLGGPGWTLRGDSGQASKSPNPNPVLDLGLLRHDDCRARCQPPSPHR